MLATLLPAVGACDEIASPADAETIKRFDVVEVTAQKRVQAPAEVPVSLHIVEGDALEQQGIKDTSELNGQAANVTITKNTADGTTPAINIRGVGNVDYNTSTTSPIGVYVDNVGGGTANFHLTNLYDIDTVEVLRGPQGTLFGRNTTGGALLINTRRPEQQFGGYVSAGIGEHAQRTFGGAFNLPVNEAVAMRLAVDDQRYDYDLNNLHAPAPRPGLRQTEARLSLLADWEPVEVFAKLHVEDWSGVSKPVRHIGVFSQLADPSSGRPAVLCAPRDAGSTLCTDIFGFNVGSNDLDDVAVNSETNGGSPHRTKSWGADLNLIYRLDEHSYLAAVSSVNQLERLHFYNADASPSRFAEGSLQVDTELFTQEIRYHREFDRGYFIGGVYASDESLTQDFFIDLFRDFRASPALFSNAVKILYDNTIDPESQAAFANLDLSLGADTVLTTGLRYTREQTEYRALGAVNVPTAVGDDIGAEFPAWNVGGRLKDDNVSGKVALNHRWSKDFNTWISVARGFKSGGYNGAIAFSAEEAQRNEYGSETLDAFEAGGNIYWNAHNAGLQFSIFYYDYQDQQVFMNTPSSVPNAPPLQLLDNVGESTLYGSELELTWRPTQALETRFGIGWMPKAELAEFVIAGGEVVRGNRLPFTPKWNLNSFVDYRLSVADGDLLMQLNGNYQSEYFFDQNQNPYTKQAGYTLWNGRLAYQTGPWVAAIWGKNLTDRGYSNTRFDLINFLGLVQDNRGEGRQLGVELTYRF
ncbi:MAG: TonB-dependent receptor [Pseudomarimonas sp.]